MLRSGTARTWGAVLLAAALLVGLPAPAGAERAAALLRDNILLTFDTATPSLGVLHPIRGLGAGETLTGIDTRPAGGSLIGATATTGSAANSVLRTYTIDATTGAASLVGATAAGLSEAGDIAGGLDVNPVSDRVRYVNVARENARLVPTTGGLANNDTTLAAGPALVGAAHDRSVAGATLTTLFAIDRTGSHLVRIGDVDGMAILPPLPVAPPPPPPSPPPPPQPPPSLPPDTARPRVLVVAPASARLTATAIGRLRVEFSCSEACSATATLKIGTTTIATGAARLAAADVGRLKLATNAAHRRAIARLRCATKRTRRARLTLTFTDAARNATSVARTVALGR